MRKKPTNLFLFFLITLCSFSQERTLEQPPGKDYSDHLLENVHLHLNKTIFTKGERLWFTAYVQDQKRQLPSVATSNLHVGVYNRSGEEIKRKMFHVENGIAVGDFAIDSTITANQYLLLVWTNYMQNFNKLKPFRQLIEILDDAPKEKPENNNELLLEVYPEGGNLIANAFNNIGIRCTDTKGRGMVLSNIDLVDDSGEVLRSNIATNSQGYGKTGFIVDESKKYFLRSEQPNGKTVTFNLPKSGSSAIGLNIDNLAKENILAKLVTSEENLNIEMDARYTLSIFQNDSVFLKDWKIGPNSRVMAINRRLIPYGVNTAVLFDESMRPVSWRMFFNHRKDAKRIVEINIDHTINTTRDSVEISFDLPENVPHPMTMSVSVLPEGTQAYMPEQSLASSFLISPYLNDALGGKYYMEDFDRRKNYALDMKLLIEGWGRYDWDSRFKEKDKIDFDMEAGIRVKGKIMDADLTAEKQAFLIADDSNAMTYADLQSDKSFEAGMILFENNSLNVSLIGQKGKIRKPKLDLQIGSAWEESGYNTIKIFNESENRMNKANSVLDTEIAQIPADKGVIALEEVVVTERVIQDNKLEINSAEVEGRLITDYEIEKYRSVPGFLRKMGYRVRIVDGRLMVLAKSVQGAAAVRPLVMIVVNGMLAQRGEVASMPLSQVQSIVMGNKVHGFAAGAGNFIAITTRGNHYVAPEYRNKFIKTLISNGYARPQQYFNPGYKYDNFGFQKYGTIDWHSKVVVNGDSPTSIIVPILSQDAIQIFAEGMGLDGSLITFEKGITLKEKLHE